MKFYINALEVFDTKVEVLVLLNEIKSRKSFHTVTKLYPRNELEHLIDCTEQHPGSAYLEMEITRVDGRLQRTFRPADKPVEQMHTLFDKPDYFADINVGDLFGDSN